MIFSMDETTDVGSDTATPVSNDYGAKNSAFSGRVHWVAIDLGGDAEDADHLLTAEERLRSDGSAVTSPFRRPVGDPPAGRRAGTRGTLPLDYSAPT